MAGLTPTQMDPAAVLERFLGQPRVARTVLILDVYGKAPGGLLANGLAFSALFAAIPTLLLALGLAGLIARDPAVVQRMTDVLAEMFPPLADLIDSSMAIVTQEAAVTGIIGLIGVIWGVSQLYVTLDVAFSRIFSAAPERDVVRRTARGFIWVAILAATIIGLVVVAWVAVAIEAFLPGSFPLGGTVASFLKSPVVLLGGAILLVGILYRVMPPVKPRFRSLALPAAAAGLAIWLLTEAFTFLVPWLVGVAALAGSLASAFITLAWLSFLFQALLFGAAWVKVREGELIVAGSGDLGTPAASAEPGGRGE